MAVIISSVILASGFVAGAVGAAGVLSSGLERSLQRSVKPGMDGVAKMADTFAASKPALTAAGHGVGAMGRSVSTLTATLTQPWYTHFLPWRR